MEVAFAETAIHESGRHVAGSFEVPVVELTARAVVRFACARRKFLVLADLTGVALKSSGLNNDMPVPMVRCRRFEQSRNPPAE